ncbi:Nucleoside-diphosphate-sugar epimerase [Vibrio crassostreae]|uniref:NAD-dependent epimerase/dehydratase family protein n=1 Tax=Vibrio crassostreae TaxID=246167 RepID=UPI0010470A4F|nr:NAD-dependent epimerase/dehydratase family protein [Vibrio crassostreae]TCN84412.1 nucleoside-diphosphate-sugar epimerase [Vibrio crassostreae]CAK2409265.1 Nucleoside-diphosphate-sugar epimerase [Vibrio crassostreae]CAK2414567.1 Nucleoside-diphosphate-sugar epimerase [Vibrio crassostreae]CAK3609461.1 Nucleoside-diphosphate-sugar epimerase [Vibrio crassostreae]CAK3795913.1 Nucleoside-diphosphate-sugar epimerase [Vibrio crassostreae]
MKILMTGATGYIGSVFADEFLNLGCSLANIGRTAQKDKRVINYSLTENYFDILESYKPDVIIHLAASFDNKDINAIIDTNIKLPLKLLEANSKTAKAKFLYIGTYWSFGDKSMPDVPIDLYSSAKKSFESFMSYYREYKNIDCVNIVLYGTYGQYDNRGKLLDYLIDCAKNKVEVNITEGKQNLNLIDVNALADEVYRLICMKRSSSNYLIASDKEYTPREMVSIISKYHELNVNFGAKKYRDIELMNPFYPENFERIIIKDELEEHIRLKFGVPNGKD